MKKLQGILCVLISLLCLLSGFSNPIQAFRIKKVGKSPNFIALSPDGTKVYATSYGTNELVGINLAKKMVTQSVLVGSSPLGLAIDDEGNTALVACKDSGTVAVVDLKTFRVLADINVGGQPNFVAMSHRGYRAYVSNYGRSGQGLLHIVDIRERGVVASIKMGISPFALVVSPITELIYVAMGGNNEVWVVDPERQVVVNKIAVGEAPDGIAITPDGKRVFVANSRSNDLSVIDTELMRVQIYRSGRENAFWCRCKPGREADICSQRRLAQCFHFRFGSAQSGCRNFRCRSGTDRYKNCAGQPHRLRHQ